MTTSASSATCGLSDFISSSTINMLSPAELKTAERIAVWNLEFALEKLVWDEKLKPDQCSIAEREFKRFILLVGMDIKPIAMISPKLDELWHQMVLFTRRYDEFCRQTVGFFVHHTPETPDNPIPVEAAEKLMVNYERLFGSLPLFWFAGMTDEVTRYYRAKPFTIKPPVRWSGWTGEDRRIHLSPFQF